MGKYIIISVFLSLLSFHNTNVETPSENWTLVKEKEGVSLFTRSVSGFKNKEVKVILDLNVDLIQARNFIYNPGNISIWMNSCSQSNTINVKDKSKVYYSIHEAPWPVTDRDDYGEMKLIKSDNSTFEVNFISLPKAGPTKKDYVRIPYSRGMIKISNNHKGSQTMEYRLLVDRGGNLPTYLLEYLENTSPLKSALNLKSELEK